MSSPGGRGGAHWGLFYKGHECHSRGLSPCDRLASQRPRLPAPWPWGLGFSLGIRIQRLNLGGTHSDRGESHQSFHFFPFLLNLSHDPFDGWGSRGSVGANKAPSIRMPRLKASETRPLKTATYLPRKSCCPINMTPRTAIRLSVAFLKITSRNEKHKPLNCMIEFPRGATRCVSELKSLKSVGRNFFLG